MLRAHRSARTQQIQTSLEADQSGQSLGAAITGNDAQIDFGLAQHQRFADDPAMTCHRQLGTSAEHGAVHRRHDGLLHRCDLVENALAALALGLRLFRGLYSGQLHDVRARE